MSQDVPGACIDHRHRIDARFGGQQPASTGIVRQSHRQHSAKILQAVNANRDLRGDLIGGRIDFRDGIIFGIRNKYSIFRGNSSQKTAPIARANHGFDPGGVRVGDIDHRQARSGRCGVC